MTRPKLNAVFGRSKPDTAQPVSSAPAPKASGSMVQMNVMVEAELRKAARMKGLEEGKEVSTVVRTLLQRWVDGDIEL